MTIFLVILHVLVCFVLILVILLQAGRGQGLSGPAFGGGNVQSLFGTRAGDFLTKATTFSAVCFLFTCIALNMIEAQKSRSLLELKRPAAALDLDAVKKALEKVKAEQEQAAKIPAEDAALTAESSESAAAASDVRPNDELLPSDSE
jgi:preprotein translocase subunit SecG